MKEIITRKTIINIILVILVTIIFIMGILFLTNKSTGPADNIDNLKISYPNGKKIEFNNFKKSFNKERIIKIENKSKDKKYYSIEWSNVENTLQKPKLFSYKISCKGKGCKTLSKTEVPIVDMNVLPNCSISPGRKQEYTITFNYIGSEKHVIFSGELEIIVGNNK